MREMASVYSRVVDYILRIVQKQLLTLYNPYTEIEKHNQAENEFSYYEIQKEGTRFKKGYKDCHDSKYLPSLISIKSEEERIEDFKKKFSIKSTTPNKPEVTLNPTELLKEQVEQAEIKENKSLESSNEKKNLLFEVLDSTSSYIATLVSSSIR